MKWGVSHLLSGHILREWGEALGNCTLRWDQELEINFLFLLIQPWVSHKRQWLGSKLFPPKSQALLQATAATKKRGRNILAITASWRMTSRASCCKGSGIRLTLQINARDRHRSLRRTQEMATALIRFERNYVVANFDLFNFWTYQGIHLCVVYAVKSHCREYPQFAMS